MPGRLTTPNSIWLPEFHLAEGCRYEFGPEHRCEECRSIRPPDGCRGYRATRRPGYPILLLREEMRPYPPTCGASLKIGFGIEPNSQPFHQSPHGFEACGRRQLAKPNSCICSWITPMTRKRHGLLLDGCQKGGL